MCMLFVFYFYTPRKTNSTEIKSLRRREVSADFWHQPENCSLAICVIKKRECTGTKVVSFTALVGILPFLHLKWPQNFPFDWLICFPLGSDTWGQSGWRHVQLLTRSKQPSLANFGDSLPICSGFNISALGEKESSKLNNINMILKQDII